MVGLAERKLGIRWEQVEPSEWESSSRASRIALLRALRAEDPSRGLSLLSSTWVQDSPDDRIAFIPELRTGLNSGDEDFLESALDDRRKEVRRKARELLACLPGSRFAERMKNRVQSLIQKNAASRLQRVLTHDSSIAVRLPEDCDAAMQRDGIEVTAPKGKGERAWWLEQITSAVPIDFWAEHLHLTPAECVTEVDRTDYADVFFSGWAIAAARHKNSEWATTLFKLALENRKHLAISTTVIEFVTPAIRENVLRELLKSDVNLFAPGQPGMRLLRSCPAPCSQALGIDFLNFVKDRIEATFAPNSNTPSLWLPNAEEFAMKMPIALAEEVQQGWREGLGSSKPIQTFLSALEFRSKMIQEINK